MDEVENSPTMRERNEQLRALERDVAEEKVVTDGKAADVAAVRRGQKTGEISAGSLTRGRRAEVEVREWGH